MVLVARRTHADLDAELLLMIANRTDITAAMRNFAFDQAYMHVGAMFKHPELEAEDSATLADNGTTFTLTATDVWWITDIRDETNDHLLTPMSRETERKIPTKPDGAPTRYVYYSETVYVDKTADGTVSMKTDYYKKPAELTSGQSSAYDWVFDEVILMMSAKFCFNRVRDYEESQKQDDEIKLYLGRQRIPWQEHRVAADAGAGLKLRTR